jgi:hypothetical protein
MSPLSRAQELLLFQDGCQGSMEYADCNSLEFGLFTLGSRGVLHLYAHLVLDLLEEVKTTTPDPTLPLATSLREQWLKLEQISSNLRNSLYLSSEYIANSDSSASALFFQVAKLSSVRMCTCAPHVSSGHCLAVGQVNGYVAAMRLMTGCLWCECSAL